MTRADLSPEMPPISDESVSHLDDIVLEEPEKPFSPTIAMLMKRNIEFFSVLLRRGYTLSGGTDSLLIKAPKNQEPVK